MMNELLLLLSLTGFFLFFRHFRKDLPASFCPALTVSVISVITCLGGIAGMLSWTVKALFFFGIISFFILGFLFLRVWCHKKDLTELVPLLWTLCPFLLFSICAIFLMRNRFLYSYDDFSHWGLVAKILLTESRLPVSTDNLMFPSYPLGSASFICFCGNVLGSSPDACLTAQNIMLISFLLSLQSAARGKWKGFLLTTLAVPLFAFYNTSLGALAVDNLLGAAFLAAVLLFLLKKETIDRVLPELMTILSCCTLIKNSGTFLALGLTLLIVLQSLRLQRKKRPSLLWAFAPLLVYLAWRIHVSTSFDSYGKHYMSLYVYYGTFRNKIGEIGSILRLILPVMVNPLKNHALLLLPAFFLVHLAISPSGDRPQQNKVLIFSTALFVLYEAGILVMYICSMGTGELFSQNGEDFPRYNGTIICVLAGILVFMSGDVLSRSDYIIFRKKNFLLLASLILMVLSLSMKMTGLMPLEEEKDSFPDPYAFSRLTKTRSFLKDQKIAVWFNDSTVSEYEAYMAGYYLYPAKIIEIHGLAEPVTKNEEDMIIVDLRQVAEPK